MKAGARSLAAEFCFVRDQLFSRWSAGATWRARLWRAAGSLEARCDVGRAIVWVSPQVAHGPLDRLRAVLAHEVTHAVAGPRHGARWQSRSEAATARAARLGFDALAGLLQADVADYRARPDIAPAQVYGDIRDAAAEGLSFRRACHAVAADLGLAPLVLLTMYPGARRAFEVEARLRGRVLPAAFAGSPKRTKRPS